MNFLKNLKEKRFINKMVFITFVIIVTLIASYFVNRIPIQKANMRNDIFYEKAIVTEIVSEDLTVEELSGYKTGTQNIKIRVTNGDMKGEVFDVINQSSYINNVLCKVGTRLIVQISISGDLRIASIYTYDRSTPLFIFIGFFCLILCVIGGKKGITSLIGLFYTIFCFMFLFVPLLYKGVSPVIASIALAILSTFVTLVLIGGWNPKTKSAILGTVTCVSFAGIISTIAGIFVNISDFTLAETDELMYAVHQNGLNIKGVMFATILIASLGAIMDVCMSIASSVNEIYTANNKVSQKYLYRAGINVGRDVMGTMANTLILVFAGGFLSTILVLSSYDITLNELFSMPGIVTEIVQGLSGSIGMFLAVPIVSFISSWFILKNKGLDH